MDPGGCGTRSSCPVLVPGTGNQPITAASPHEGPNSPPPSLRQPHAVPQNRSLRGSRPHPHQQPPAAHSSLHSPSARWWMCVELPMSLANPIDKRTGVSSHRRLAHQTSAPSHVSESRSKAPGGCGEKDPPSPRPGTTAQRGPACPARGGSGRRRLPAQWERGGGGGGVHSDHPAQDRRAQLQALGTRRF